MEYGQQLLTVHFYLISHDKPITKRTMKEIFDGIAQIGFPIVVSILLLVRVESKMELLGKRINELNDTIVKLSTIIDERLIRRK